MDILMEDRDYLLESLLMDMEVETLVEAGDGAGIMTKINSLVNSIKNFISNGWKNIMKKIDDRRLKAQAEKINREILHDEVKIDKEREKANSAKDNVSILKRIYDTIANLCNNIRSKCRELMDKIRGQQKVKVKDNETGEKIKAEVVSDTNESIVGVTMNTMQDPETHKRTFALTVQLSNGHGKHTSKGESKQECVDKMIRFIKSRGIANEKAAIDKVRNAAK